MTSNQIALAQLQEQQRSNKANENIRSEANSIAQQNADTNKLNADTNKASLITSGVNMSANTLGNLIGLALDFIPGSKVVKTGAKLLLNKNNKGGRR